MDGSRSVSVTVHDVPDTNDSTRSGFVCAHQKEVTRGYSRRTGAMSRRELMLWKGERIDPGIVLLRFVCHAYDRRPVGLKGLEPGQLIGLHKAPYRARPAPEGIERGVRRTRRVPVHASPATSRVDLVLVHMPGSKRVSIRDRRASSMITRFWQDSLNREST